MYIHTNKEITEILHIQNEINIYRLPQELCTWFAFCSVLVVIWRKCCKPISFNLTLLALEQYMIAPVPERNSEAYGQKIMNNEYTLIRESTKTDNITQ